METLFFLKTLFWAGSVLIISCLVVMIDRVNRFIEFKRNSQSESSAGERQDLIAVSTGS
jgi:hypothetical protein